MTMTEISTPVTPKPASSVLVVRERNGHREVLLTRRRPELAFLGGYIVFPGGKVDAEDYRAIHRVCDLQPGEAGEQMALPDNVARAHWVAAFRELHEEVGLWLGDGYLPEKSRWIADVADGSMLPASRLQYIDHWVTPEWVPMRFTTRFFISRIEGDPVLTPSTTEIDMLDWFRPERALELVAQGDLLAIRPTITLLERLAGIQDDPTAPGYFDFEMRQQLG